MIPAVKWQQRFLKIFLSFVFVILTYSDCYNQVISGTQKTSENIYLARTKQFNEFVDRFNYKTDFYGNLIDSIFRAKMPREKFLNSLFDLKDRRILKGNDTYSGGYAATKSRFISEIFGKELKINKYSGKIIAEAKSKVLFRGAAQSISIFLNQETVGKDMIKWVILDVKGDILNFLKEDTSLIRFISPGSHETDFINLKRALEDIDYLQYYASENYNVDLLTLFFYYLNTKVLKFEYVEEVTYHILDIPGWCIKVKDFNRNDLNSGWLISDLAPNNFGIKDYIRNLH